MTAGVAGAPTRDRQLAVVGGLCVALAVGGVACETLGLLPSSAAVVVVLITAGVGLRVATLFVARSASSTNRARVMKIVSTVGLAVSAVTAIASLPVLTRAGGMGPFTTDLEAELWALALLTIAAAPVRTMGWRVMVGTGFTGFLALTALARLIGSPVVTSLGQDSVVATSIWVPVTEELCQALPLILVLFFAARRATARPSAVDIALIGAWSGAGFALYENTQFGRGHADWTGSAPFSLLFPSIETSVGSPTMIIASHTIWVAVVGLGCGFGILYRRRYRYAWLAVPVAVLATLMEHGAVNALAAPGTASSSLESLAVGLTLGGALSSLLLVVGIGGVLWIEWRALRSTSRPAEWLLLRPELAARRGHCLAVAQRPVEPTVATVPLTRTGIQP